MDPVTLPGPQRIECRHRTFANKLHCAAKLQRGQYLVYMQTTLQLELDAICKATGRSNHMGEVYP